jgi:non-heme chloroperoxidase
MLRLSVPHVLCALFATIVFSTSALPAATTKSYTVTAPDGVVLAVPESGNPQGRAVILIHGLLGSRLDWEAQSKGDALQRYRLISYDLRGHGLSGKPTDAAAYQEGRRWADDLAAVIEASHASRPVLVGWSLGGVVISNYLAAYGDELIAGAVYVDGVIELRPEQLMPHPDVYRDLVSTDLKTHLDAERAFLALCFRTQPDRATFERLLANAAMASWTLQGAVQSMTVAAEEGLGRVRVPVLLIYGSRDALLNPKAALARALQLDPRLQSKRYDNSGHAPFIEEPERFNRDLSIFVESTGLRGVR